MLATVKNFFARNIESPAADSQHQVKLATAAILLEMVRADFAETQQERVSVEKSLQEMFDLTAEESQELTQLGEEQVDAAACLYQFTSLVNGQFTLEQKVQVIESLWQVAYSDGVLDKYEEHLVRKVAELLYVPHKNFVQAKHRAMKHQK